jgi:hypothetical protein
VKNASSRRLEWSSGKEISGADHKAPGCSSEAKNLMLKVKPRDPGQFAALEPSDHSG